MTENALIVIFNHKFEKNLKKLRKIYSNKFENMYFLMPFYRGEEKDVISVYENSYNFHGYFPQGLNKFYEENFNNYIFIADDLLLNPKLTSNNIIKELNLCNNSGYIKNISPLSDYYIQWLHYHKVLDAFEYQGFDFLKELPDSEEINKSLLKYGIIHSNIKISNFKDWNGNLNYKDIIKNWGFYKEFIFLMRKKTLPYPFLASYSDFFIVPKIAIEKFCHYCGIFAAINLFAEISIPTALFLSCPKIMTELEIGENFITGTSKKNEYAKWYGKEIWDLNSVILLEDQYKNSLVLLQNSFPENLLYIHPVKISKWVI